MSTGRLVALSYGGGMQTVALTILAADGKIARPDVVIMADTGDEPEGVYAHVEVMRDYMASHGLDFVVVQSANGPLSKFMTEKRKVVTPMFGSRGGQIIRVCTERWKIREVRRELRKRGATKAVVQLGISVDEIQRMKDSPVKWITHSYPLIDLRLTRQDCERIIGEAGLPIPPKSACWHCPFRTPYGWQKLRNDDPISYQKAVVHEAAFPNLYLNDSLKPIEEVVAAKDAAPELFDEGACTSGYCFT